jgi:hypothetical protein
LLSSGGISSAPVLPGGGQCYLLAARSALSVVDQHREDGWIYRCLLCRDGAGELQVLSLVRCRHLNDNARPTRGRSVEFDRSWLAPQYHRAMLCGLLWLRPASAKPVTRVLHIGVGCGVLAMAIRSMGETREVPEISDTVVQECIESNPDALALGRAYFGLAAGPRLRLFSEAAERCSRGSRPARTTQSSSTSRTGRGAIRE